MLSSQEISKTPGLCLHLISIQYQIYLPSAKNIAYHLTLIKLIIKKDIFTSNDTHLTVVIANIITS